MLKPQVIVYLWFVPVILYFVAPLLFAPFIMMRKRLSPAHVSEVRGGQYARGGEGERIFYNTREHPRQKVEGMIAHVSDGKRCCVGEVKDVSRRGLSIATPLGELDRQEGALGVLLTGSGMSFPLKVLPQWQVSRNGEQITGAVIIDAVGNLRELVGTAAYGATP